MPKHIPRNPDTLPYPKFDSETLLKLDAYLAYFESAAQTAVKTMEAIPESERVEWYSNNIQYWRNVRSGFRHARGVAKRSRGKHGSKRQHCTETFDTAISGGRDT